MLRRSKVILQTNEFTALYDKGYHTGSEFKVAHDHGIEVMVAIPLVASHAPDINYDVANFIYDEKADTYTCPQRQVLTTNGTWYKRDRGKSIIRVKHYKTNTCQDCPVNNLCTKNKEGRLIARSEHAAYIEQNKRNIDANAQVYKKRQAIVEHPYGILKRQWGFYYIITKRGKKRASADVGFMFIAYNMRRMMNILGHEKFKKFLKELPFLFFKIFITIKSKSFKITNSAFFNQHLQLQN